MELWAALVVAVVGPLLLSWLNNRNAMQIKRQDWERQDEVAARVEAVAKAAAVNAANVDTQLKQIHTLVNSDMTAARQSELIAVEAHLATLRRNVATHGEPSDDEQTVMDNLSARADELRSILADRLAQQKAVEQMAQPTKP
jgi:hypothetical protein